MKGKSFFLLLGIAGTLLLGIHSASFATEEQRGDDLSPVRFTVENRLPSFRSLRTIEVKIHEEPGKLMPESLTKSALRRTGDGTPLSCDIEKQAQNTYEDGSFRNITLVFEDEFAAGEKKEYELTFDVEGGEAAVDESGFYCEFINNVDDYEQIVITRHGNYVFGMKGDEEKLEEVWVTPQTFYMTVRDVWGAAEAVFLRGLELIEEPGTSRTVGFGLPELRIVSSSPYAVELEYRFTDSVWTDPGNDKIYSDRDLAESAVRVKLQRSYPLIRLRLRRTVRKKIAGESPLKFFGLFHSPERQVKTLEYGRISDAVHKDKWYYRAIERKMERGLEGYDWTPLSEKMNLETGRLSGLLKEEQKETAGVTELHIPGGDWLYFILHSKKKGDSLLLIPPEFPAHQEFMRLKSEEKMNQKGFSMLLPNESAEIREYRSEIYMILNAPFKIDREYAQRIVLDAAHPLIIKQDKEE